MLSERLNAPISTAELERRWTSVRNAMEDAGLDVLLIFNNSERLGGYVRWFTDMPAGMYPTTIVFPRADPMTVVIHGPIGDDIAVAPGSDPVWRGVDRILSTASFSSASYTSGYDIEAALKALERYSPTTVGLVGAQLPDAAATMLRRALPSVRLVDAASIVDRIKAVKSEEEQQLIRIAAQLQDEVMRQTLDVVEPGKRERDITAFAARVALELGSEEGIFLASSYVPGEPAGIAPRHVQHRMLGEGDVFALLIEVDGPGGMYAELGRTCTLGPAPAQLLEELELTLAAQRFTLDQLRPGAAPAEIWSAYNEFLRDSGRPEERRIHCHGQGHDLVERPLIRNDEPMELAAGMNLACHPTYMHAGFLSWICDNHLIQADGPPLPLHEFPQKITER